MVGRLFGWGHILFRSLQGWFELELVIDYTLLFSSWLGCLTPITIGSGCLPHVVACIGILLDGTTGRLHLSAANAVFFVSPIGEYIVTLMITPQVCLNAIFPRENFHRCRFGWTSRSTPEARWAQLLGGDAGWRKYEEIKYRCMRWDSKRQESPRHSDLM